MSLLDDLYAELTKAREAQARHREVAVELAAVRKDRDYLKSRVLGLTQAVADYERGFKVLSPEDDRWLEERDAVLKYSRKLSGGAMLSIRVGGRTSRARKEEGSSMLLMSAAVDAARKAYGA